MSDAFATYGKPSLAIAVQRKGEYLALHPSLREAMARRKWDFGLAERPFDYGPMAREFETPRPDRQTSIFFDFVKGRNQAIVVERPQGPHERWHGIAPPPLAFHMMAGSAVSRAFGDLHDRPGFRRAQRQDWADNGQPTPAPGHEPDYAGNFATIWAAQALSTIVSDFPLLTRSAMPHSWNWVKANVPSARWGLNLPKSTLNTPDLSGCPPLANLAFPELNGSSRQPRQPHAAPVSAFHDETMHLLKQGAAPCNIEKPVLSALLKAKRTPAIRAVIDHEWETRPWGQRHRRRPARARARLYRGGVPERRPQRLPPEGRALSAGQTRPAVAAGQAGGKSLAVPWVRQAMA